LARLATENNVPLYFRLTPALGTDAESFDGLQSSLKQLYEECPQMIPTRPELVLYDGTFFGETLHLNGRGADRFTACVAEEMAGLLDVP
jgi:hypothetical protein